MRFLVVSLSTLCVPTLCLKDQRCRMTNLSGTSFDGWGGSLEQVAGMLATSFDGWGGSLEQVAGMLATQSQLKLFVNK